MNSIETVLTEYGIVYRKDCTLADLTTFKVGGPAALVLYPESVEQCAFLLRLAAERGKSLVFLGNGSNVLGTDKGTEEWILKTDRLNSLSLDEKNVLSVGAGVKNVKASSFALENGLSGLEFAHGIPGTIGGAVFMNAGAYGGTMDQIVLRTHYMKPSGEIAVLEKEAHAFGYRKSFFLEHPEYLILKTELQLACGDKNEIRSVIDDFQRRRKEKQPLEYPSAGSTFKRPEGYFAGKLIEDCGLKGYSIGGAQVSEKHAGFVINREGATGSDVRSLIAYVQEKVKSQFGVDLECEVRSLGKE